MRLIRERRHPRLFEGRLISTTVFFWMIIIASAVAIARLF